MSEYSNQNQNSDSNSIGNGNSILGKIVPIEDSFPRVLTLLPIKVRPVFPGIITPLVVPNGRFINSIEESFTKGQGYVGLILLKKDDSDEDSESNIYQIGVIARIIKRINLPDGGLNILVNTLQRFQIQSIFKNDDGLLANVSFPKEEPGANKNTIKALMRTLIILTKELSQNNPLFTEEMKLTMMNVNEPAKMSDFVCSILNLEKEEYQSVIESLSTADRLEKVLLYLNKEIELIRLQRKLQLQINEKIDKQQRNFYLREQLKAIQQELGGAEDNRPEKKYLELLKKMEEWKVDPQVITEIKREVDKFSSQDPNSSEHNITKNYLDTIESLPWKPSEPRVIDLKKAKAVLDRDHFKLDDVKQRILEFLAVRKLNPVNRGSILCLVGPPGVGKTSIAKSIAIATGRKFFRFSLGGMRDEAEIKGHRRTYIGAMPGKIISALRVTKEKDPIILLDEIDKLSQGLHGDPASALLEVLDPEQNTNFRDHYLDFPFDLSNVFFIATANGVDTIPRVLLDRMEVITLHGYITEEKISIFQKHLWKKSLERSGLKNSKFEISKPAIKKFIDDYSRESGLRGLEKNIDKITRKLAYDKVTGAKLPKKIDDRLIHKYLGEPTFKDDLVQKQNLPGCSIGLAWTNYGGSVLRIETTFIEPKDKLLITGQIGKTMDESASIALSFVKSFLGSPNALENRGIHLHVPDGATPKDGPSAGITIATAFASLAMNRPMVSGIAMTGEIGLKGEVLPIGGLREKIVSAKRLGIRKIIFPKENVGALAEVPEYVKTGMQFFPVSHFSEVANLVFPKSSSSKNSKKILKSSPKKQKKRS